MKYFVSLTPKHSPILFINFINSMQMKKFTKLFSVCLAFFVCLGTAWAQEEETVSLPVLYSAGDPVSEITPDTEFFLQQGPSYISAGKYLGVAKADGAKEYSITHFEAVDANSIWVFEEVTGETKDNHQVYRLKNKNQGLYLKAIGPKGLPTEKDLAEGATTTEWSTWPELTDKASEAFLATVLHPVDTAYTEDPRQSTSTNSGDRYAEWDPNSFVISDINDYPLVSGGILYFCHYLYYSGYQDTNQWVIGEIYTENDPLSVLGSLVSVMFPNPIEDTYIVGNNPGQYGAEEVQALIDAFNAAQAIQPGATYDECNAAYVALVAAKKACDESLVKVKDGSYYFIIYNRAANGMYATTDNVIKHTANYAVPTDTTVTVDDARYMWKTVASTVEGEEGMFYLQNYYTGKYASIQNVNYAAAPTTDEPEIAFTFQTGVGENNGGVGRFKLVGTNGQRLHCDNSGNMVRWNEGDGNANYAQFITADALVSALAEQVAQNKLNEALKAVYEPAKAVYDKGFIFGFTEDSVFRTNDGLVTSSTQLSTNAQEASEGPIAGLLDGNFATYFHSDWHHNVDDAFHNIQADLGEPVSGVVLKYAKRVNNNNSDKPGEFRVSVANDPNGEWVELCDSVLAYQYSNTAVNSTNVDLKAAFAGSIELDFGAEYQYIRLECTKTTGMIASGLEAATGTMIQLSELRFYKVGDVGQVETSALQNVPAGVRSALEAAMAKAEEELAAGAATQATIDELKAAYDAFAAEFADADVLRTAIEAARTAYNEVYPLGTELGEYDETLKNKIKEVVDAQQALIDSGEYLTKEVIAAGKAALEAAVKAFEGSVVLPEAGKYYILRRAVFYDEDGEVVAHARNAAPIYSLGNSETTQLLNLAQVDGVDGAQYESFYNMVWKAEACENGKITLRNVGTGFYLGEQSEVLAGAAPNVKKQTSLAIEGAKMSGTFFVVLGEHEEHGKMYLNISGSGENMCAWNDTDANSHITFEDVTDEFANNFFGTSNWYLPGDEGAFILTLPYDIDASQLYGGVYEPIGVIEDAEAETASLELLLYAETVIPGGTPFVYVPDESEVTNIGGRTFLPIVLSATSLDEIEYVSEAKTVGILVGSMTGAPAKEEDEYTSADLIPNESIVFVDGEPVITGKNSSLSERLAKANSGYILKNITEETGDIAIPLEGLLSTSINAVLNGNTGADVYSISGVKVRKNANTKGLPSGVYVVDGKKVLVK